MISKKQILKFTALIICAVNFFSCCPKLQTTVSKETETTEKVDTGKIFNPPDTIKEIHTDTVLINFSSLCDSLKKGLIKNRSVYSSTKTIDDRTIQGTLIVDSLGIASLFCNENEWIKKNDSLLLITRKLETIIKEKTETVSTPRGFEFYKNGFFILCALFVLCLFLFIKK